MTIDTVMPELDVFQLPVFRLADKFPLILPKMVSKSRLSLPKLTANGCSLMAATA